MLRRLRKLPLNNPIFVLRVQRKTFLTNEYKCTDAWFAQTSSPILNKVNINDFYNLLSQNHSTKGLISAVDVDIFANVIKEPIYLEELKDLLHKLRLSAETGNTLESTHHATVRNFIEFGNIEDLLQILKDPLNFGVFLDYYTANILLDKLLVSNNYEQAANVASLIMLQEEYDNDITCALSQYACYKYIVNYQPPEPLPLKEEPKKTKIEEIKIRVRYLRNPYFDDHFDIKDTYTLAGKTLAWMSEKTSDNLNNNLKVIGLLAYKKFDELLLFSENLKKTSTFKLYKEVCTLLEKEINSVKPEEKDSLSQSINLLKNAPEPETNLEKSLKNKIENAINKSQITDITQQKLLFQSWTEIREQKLEEQAKRLDRAKRLQHITEKQKELQEEEQKLWFFNNEESIDLQIEEKEKLPSNKGTVKSLNTKDEDYIPPEILPKQR